MAEEYGPWLGWNGGECPVEPETRVQVIAFDIAANELRGYAHSFYWGRDPGDRPIIAYRVKREPRVETVRDPAHFWRARGSGPWILLNSEDAFGDVLMRGFLVYETRDGIPDMTTLRWEDAT